MKQQLTCDDLIVGAGMQGIMAARACISAGRDCIVIDKGRSVGGILKPEVFDGVSVDSGCHIWGAREKMNISFIETHVGVEMIPVHGHCEISACPDGTLRRRLAVPSFEELPDQVRHEAIQRARAMDPDVLASQPIGVTFPMAFGSHVSNAMLSMAERMYGRDPADLTIGAAAQMALRRVKLHTCDELRSCQQGAPDFGPLLCTHPLDAKSDTLVKYRYPRGGLSGLAEACRSWMQSRTQELILSASPRSLSVGPGEPGGSLETGEQTIEFQRLMWCCNPLVLGTLVDLPLPPKESTAGSPFRLICFEICQGDCRVEYSHDFRLDSPMFRSWIPPAEMTAGRSDRRYVVVECPRAAKTPETIEAVHDHVAHLHGFKRQHLRYVGTQPQVRFFPTVTYVKWLQQLSGTLMSHGGSILIPEVPLYGKDVITDWWTRAVAPMPGLTR